MSLLIQNKFRLGKKIGAGSFGDVYLGYTIAGEKVAIKFENQRTRFPQLRHEAKVYKCLQGGGAGFPRIKWFGQQDGYNILVMDILGPSLEDIFEKMGRYCTFTISAACVNSYSKN
jgi:serine/threonine protein kinase